MLTELVGLGILVLTGTVGGTIGALLNRRPKTLSSDEKRCTGYHFGRGVVSEMLDDCTALRSPDCKDGRCSYHCDQMCRCTAPLWTER